MAKKPPVKQSVPMPKKLPKPKTGQAGLYGGLGPTAYVNNLYAPSEKVVADQQAQRTATLHGLVNDFLNSLHNVGDQLKPYTAAASQQSSDANNAAAALAAANPNAVTQNDLQSIGAPGAQQAAVTAKNSTAFGGNAALLQYAGGVIPSDQFRSDAAANASYLAALPGIGETLGLRGLGALNSLASKENLTLAGQKADALQQARSALATSVNQKQSNAISQAAVVGNLLGYIPAGMLGNKNPITTLSGTKFTYDKNQDRKKANAAAVAAGIYDPTKSNSLKFRVDANGRPILKNGRLQPLPGYRINKTGDGVVAIPGAKGGKGKGGLTATKAAGIHIQAGKDAEDFFHGVQKPDGSVVSYAIPWQDALKTMVGRYGSTLGRAAVMRILNRWYKPGGFFPDGKTPNGRPATRAQKTAAFRAQIQGDTVGGGDFGPKPKKTTIDTLPYGRAAGLLGGS
jgi:hypothetical protein